MNISEIINNNTTKKLLVFNGSNDEPRWSIPIDAKKPTFLNLYNGQGLKANVFKLVITIAFYFGVKKFFASSVVSGCVKDKYQSILNDLHAQSYSIFYGTPGENRKIIIEISDANKTFAFMKIPTSSSSRKLIHNETRQINLVSSFNLKLINIPEILYESDDLIVISNVKPVKKDFFKGLTNTHILAIEEIYNIKGYHICSIKNSSFIKENHTHFINVNKIPVVNSNEVIEALYALIKEHISIIKNEDIKMCLAHGDFTPWNMYISEKKLYLYDWELSHNSMPMLYDFFHYIFQESILVDNANYEDIKLQLENIKQNTNFNLILKKYDLDFDLYLKIYILSVSIYYLPKYMMQENIFEQAYRSINMWHHFLTDLA
jgi:hypothetical protein